MKRKSIIYVNYSPYENTGSILDYILEKYQLVFLFSLNFHKLSNKSNYNSLNIYKNSKIIKTYRLFQIPAHSSILYIFLPFRSLINLIQIYYYVYLLTRKYGKIDDYFTVNAFTAWVGIVLRRIGFVKRTIFWIWDYYPPLDRDKVIVLMRWIYWQFDKYATTYSDRLIFLNQRLIDLREDIGIFKNNSKTKIVPIGTTNEKIRKVKSDSKLKFIFIGVVKKSQGLDLLIDASKSIKNLYPDASVDVIGNGPDLEYFKNRSNKSFIPFRFHGMQSVSDSKTRDLFLNANIGIATYKPEVGNVSFYGDPSKIKLYMSYLIPVITTNVFQFSSEIKKSESGIVIKYNKNDLLDAINKVMDDYDTYRSNTLKMRNKYQYKKIYNEIFSYN